jgi:hypothetical protein
MKKSGKNPIREYFDKIHEANKKGPANWIITSPRIAYELNKLTKNNGRKKQ